MSDRFILPGLHATLASLLSNSDPRAFRTVLFSDGLRAKDIDLLRRTVTGLAPEHIFEIRPLSYDLPNVRSLRGNYTTYARLLLPELLPDSPHCLFLDCDVIVVDDIMKLLEESKRFPGACVVADGKSRRQSSLDQQLFCRLGLPLDGPCFNAGVMFMNLEQWRAMDVTAECLRFMNDYPNDLLGADQTVLNVVLHSRFASFDTRWNMRISYLRTRLAEAEAVPGIYHFAGAPKPWDLLGFVVHPNYWLWQKWFNGTALEADLRWRLTACVPTWRAARLLPATLRRLRDQVLRNS